MTYWTDEVGDMAARIRARVDARDKAERPKQDKKTLYQCMDCETAFYFIPRGAGLARCVECGSIKLKVIRTVRLAAL